MKMLVGLMTMVLSASTIASTNDSKTFVYDGSQNSVELLLKAEKTHTEYRYENTRSTCYRTDVVGYRQVCHGGGGYGPRPMPGPGPYPRGPSYPQPMPRQCYSEPIYRQVAYSCMQTVRIPFEVKDFDVEARVIVDVTKLSPEATPGEKFKATLIGDSLSFQVTGSKKFFIVKKKQDIRSSMNGSVKMIDAVLATELIEAAPVLNAIKMTNISISKNVLNFEIGQVESRDHLGFSLKVVKTKVFGSDTVLIDRDLEVSEVEVTATADGSDAGVSMESLGLDLSNGRYSITVKAFAKLGGSLMNTSQFDELSASRTLVYKVR